MVRQQTALPPRLPPAPLADNRVRPTRTRSPDDPNVQARLAHLREKNGLKGLEIVHYSEIERATKLFLRDGVSSVH